MKRRLTWVLLLLSFGARAATTIDAGNRFSYGANPTNANSALRITYAARGEMTPDSMTLHWDSVRTRCYTIESRDSFGTMDSWKDLVSLGLGTSNATFNVGVPNQTEFYRVQAYRRLGP